MILNFSLWVHNYTARRETEIKDDQNALKPDQRQNLSMRFDDLSRHFKKIWPSVRLLSSFICLKKLLGTGVEFHSQFIQVCLSAIKTRQHALIFYTRKGSQKAITHKFLIMFCLLPSVTTRTSRRRNPFAAKKSSNTTVQIKDKCMEHVAHFFHGYQERHFLKGMARVKSNSLIQDDCPELIWVDILRQAMITKRRILTGELAI